MSFDESSHRFSSDRACRRLDVPSELRPCFDARLQRVHRRPARRAPGRWRLVARRERSPSQRMISPRSACADIESILAMRACTGDVAVDLHLVGAVDELRGRACRRPGSRRTARCSADRAGRGEVVQHAAAGGHAARGDDDRRSLARSAPSTAASRRPSWNARGGELRDLMRRAHVWIELRRSRGVELQRLDGHRAVDVDGQHRECGAPPRACGSSRAAPRRGRWQTPG